MSQNLQIQPAARREEQGRKNPQTEDCLSRQVSCHKNQKKDLSRYTQELEEAYTSILRILAMAIDARDSYTLGHSARVALHSLMIGQEIGLKENELEELEIASLFRDVGKLKTQMPSCLKTGL